MTNHGNSIIISEDSEDSFLIIKKFKTEIIIWNLLTLENLGEYKLIEQSEEEHLVDLEDFPLTVHNKQIYFGYLNGSVHVWDITTKKETKILNTESPGPIALIKISSEFNIIVSGVSSLGIGSSFNIKACVEFAVIHSYYQR